MSIKELDQVNADGDRWSSLPVLLLWMIKARLDYPNRVRFASVCKSWLRASESCRLPFNYENELVENFPPWIMRYKETQNENGSRREFFELYNDSRREFFNILTEERYTMDYPEFSGSDVVYSRQGWLLLVRLGLGETANFADTSFYSPCLFNPFKNLKIKLPYVDDHTAIKLGAFTIKDGNPDYIILSSEKKDGSDDRRKIELYTTHRGDNAWVRYSYTYNKVGHESTSWVFIIENSVCLITTRGSVFVFNNLKLHWTELSKKLSKQWYLMFFGSQYMVEKKGELFFIRFSEWVRDSDKVLDKAIFYKLNIGEEEVYWEPIDSRPMSRDFFWFLTDNSCRRSFVSDANEVVKPLATFGKFVNKTWVQFKGSRRLKLVHMC